MWWRLGIHPFTRSYFQNLVTLLAIGFVTSTLVHVPEALPETASLFLFLLVCLGSMGMLYRHNVLVDTADREVIQAAFEACVSRIRKKEPIYHA
jgi:hypothetical protein